MTDTLGPYELVRLLGKGGMGEVFLARDTRLEREVALKLLPGELEADDERRGRFLREARAAAGLSHPNITTILDVGTSEGRDYIAQEYLDGRPLNEIVAERKLPLAELATLAVPLADALGYAHERGVIHRDLKPANVIITSRGLPKLLDFGLAKVLKDDGEDRPVDQSTTLTLSGAVFGTPSAMSPEQALGKVVDARGDVFSFGALLYEMATGKPPFLGATVQETLDRVLHAEPESLQRLRRDLPSDFVAIVSKALRKDPAERYQTMAEMAADLRHFQRTTDSGLVPPAEGRAGGGVGRVARGLAVAAVVLLAGWGAWQLVRSGGRLDGGPLDDLPRFTNPRQVTTTLGWEGHPSWSADGNLLAYHGRSGETGSGAFDIFVTQVGAGSPVNRTAELEGDAMFPSISPDGAQIAFCLIEDADIIPHRTLGYYTVPVLSGAPRALDLEGLGADGPCWSRDSQRLARLVEGAGEVWSVRVDGISGEAVSELPLPTAIGHPIDLAWSADERLFAYTTSSDRWTSDVSMLWLAPADGSAPVSLTDGNSLVQTAAFAPDGRELLYVSNQAGTRDIWVQPLGDDGLPDGPAQALTAGMRINSLSLSADGTRLACSNGGLISNVWRLPVDAEDVVTWADGRQVTFDEAVCEFVDCSPDGRFLALSSDRAGNDDLWVLPSEGGSMRQLTTDPAPDWFPRWSPDGEQILFYSHRSGNRDLWIMPSQGGSPVQLTDDPGTDWFGKWSLDGTRVSYLSGRVGTAQLTVTSLDPWAPRTIVFDEGILLPTTPSDWVDEETLLVQVGPDLALAREDGSLVRVYEGVRNTSGGRQLPGTRQVVVGDGQGLALLDLDTGEARPLARLEGRPGELGLVGCTDGEFVWITWLEERGDLWVMDVERRG